MDMTGDPIDDDSESTVVGVIGKGATATVESVNGGFRVDVRSDEPASAAEISRRAKTLGSGAAR